MPKKLQALTTSVNTLKESYSEGIGSLVGFLKTCQTHITTINEAEELLLGAIQKAQQKGHKGTTVNDFYSKNSVLKDVHEVKPYVDGIEEQKKNVITASTNYWAKHSEVSRLLTNDCHALLNNMQTIIDDKSAHWFGSDSLPAIRTLKGEFSTWLTDATRWLNQSEKVPKPDKLLKWAAPGSTKSQRISDLHIKGSDLNTLEGVLKELSHRMNVDTSRAKTLKGIYERLEKVAKKNTDV